MTTKDDRINFSLRLNSDLSEKVEKAAKDMGLSKNQYINQVLREEVLHQDKAGA